MRHVLFRIMNRKFNWMMGQSPQHNIQQFIFMYQEGFTLFNISKFNTILLYYLYKEVFFFFQATDEESIVKLSETLSSKGIDHKLWIEQPENIPTCIATRPYVKENIQENFKKFKLFKA